MYEYDKEDLQGLIDFLGIPTKKSGREIQFKYCPICHSSKADMWTASINEEKGLFHCHRGSCPNPDLNFLSLSKAVGYAVPMHGEYKPYRYTQPKERNTRQEAADYLQGRGISMETSRRYFCTVKRDNPEVLVFPFYDEQNILQCVKFRHIKPKPENVEKWSKEWFDKPSNLKEDEKVKPILFGMYQCDPAADSRLIITEGQIDSLSVAEAGYINAVSVPNGKNGFTWLDNCKDWIESNFTQLIVFGDNEKDGMTLLERLTQEISIEVKAVRLSDYLGCKDANEILQQHGIVAIMDCIERAVIPPLNGIISVSSVKKQDRSQVMRCRSGFQMLDRCITGLETARLYVVTGKRGEGKSTFISQIVANILTMNDEKQPKALIYSGELQNNNFKMWIYRQCSDESDIIHTESEEYGDEYDVQDYKVLELDGVFCDKLFIVSDEINADLSVDLTQLFTDAVKRYKVNYLVIDNLMSLVGREDYQDQYSKQSQIVSKLAVMAHSLNIGIFLIAHPKKSSTGDLLNDISGSADIVNLADVTLWFSRDRSDHRRDGVLEVMKNRVNGKLLLAKRDAKGAVTDGGDEISIAYDPVTMKLTAIQDNMIATVQARAEAAKETNIHDDLYSFDDGLINV